MTKGLKSFRRFRDNIRWLQENTSLGGYFKNDNLHFKEDLDTIETALKDYEELKIANSEQFKEKWVQDNLAMTFELNVAKHKLKALDIINNKNVCIATLKDSDSLEEYNDVICYHKVRSMTFEKPIPLTQEEYDLLKEELINN